MQALIPGLTTPAVLITNTTANLLESIPQALGIPAFVIPNSMLNAVNLLLPNLTAVPTIIHDVASQVGRVTKATEHPNTVCGPDCLIFTDVSH